MTGGEALAGVVLKAAAILHSILNGWVNVTNVAGENGNQMGFSLVPAGVSFAQWMADVTEAYAAFANEIAHIPLLGASIANLLLVLMW